MKTNNYGQVIVTDQEAFEALYSGKIKDLSDVIIESGIDRYNCARKLNADSIPELKNLDNLEFDSLELFDEANQCSWFMPEEYNNFPMHQWLLDQCMTDEERARVEEELILFIKHGMFDLLFYLKYLVDVMRENKLVWGVGRGSSVSSYILFLIGVHKVNSIRYNLDIHEFLK